MGLRLRDRQPPRLQARQARHPRLSGGHRPRAADLPAEDHRTATPGCHPHRNFGKPANTYSEITWFVDGVPQPRYKTYNSASSTFPVSAAHAGARVDARLKIYRTDGVGNYVDGSDTYQRARCRSAEAHRPRRCRSPSPGGRPTVTDPLGAGPRHCRPEGDVEVPVASRGPAIRGATASRYTVRGVDVNKALKVRVTVSRPGWPTSTSAPPRPPSRSEPSRSGGSRPRGRRRSDVG